MLLKQHSLSKELQQCSDEDLITLFYHTSDHKFFSELFSRYADLAYRICLKYLRDIEASKDQVMCIFSRLYEKCRQQRIRIECFKSWLYTCIRNECSSHMRSSSRKLNRLNAYNCYITAHQSHDINKLYVWEEQRMIKDTQQKLHQALLQLPSAQRQCLYYFYYEKNSYKTTAEKIGISIKEVKSHIQNGKRNMKNMLS